MNKNIIMLSKLGLNRKVLVLAACCLLFVNSLDKCAANQEQTIPRTTTTTNPTTESLLRQTKNLSQQQQQSEQDLKQKFVTTASASATTLSTLFTPNSGARLSGQYFSSPATTTTTTVFVSNNNNKQLFTTTPSAQLLSTSERSEHNNYTTTPAAAATAMTAITTSTHEKQQQLASLDPTRSYVGEKPSKKMSKAYALSDHPKISGFVVVKKMSKTKQQTTPRKSSEMKQDDASGQKQSPMDNSSSEQGEPIDRSATSQMVSFAEPNQQQPRNSRQQLQETEQKQQQKSSGGNRWTHFGARLKPLATVGVSADHHVESASNMKSLAMKSANSNGNGNKRPQLQQQQQQQQQQQAAASRPQPVAASSLQANQVGDDQEDSDDGQDSEALLYKMMQQQSFLISPDWGQQQSEASLRGQENEAAGRSSASLPVGLKDQAYAIGGSSSKEPSANSKRVIKLLKSYSHIHQVDDSDDQIRGTHTRVPVRRPPMAAASSGNSWQQARESSALERQNRNRSPQVKPTYSGRSRDYESGESDEYSSSGNNNNNNQDEPRGAAANQEDDFECPNNGIFADEASGCQYYHVCQSGAQVQQRFQCPMGTLFNNIILTCDFAHNVQCNKPNARTEHTDQLVYQPPQQYHQQVPQKQVAPLRQQQPRPRTSSPSSQPRWQPQQQPTQQIRQQQPQPTSGPRQLRIGQGAAYSSTPLNSLDSNDNDDDSDEPQAPVAPLIPARLPYSAPPPSAAVHSHHHHHQQESAHRSQYPSSMLGEYDGATVSTPVYAARDERRYSAVEPAKAQTNTVQQQQQQQQQAVATHLDNSKNDQNSYKLLINHVAPQQQAATVQPSQRPQQVVVPSVRPQQHPLQEVTPKRQQQQVSPTVQTGRPTSYKSLRDSQDSQIDLRSLRKQLSNQQESTRATGSLAQQRAQTSAAHASRQYQQHLFSASEANGKRAPPVLVDLTNDGRQSVSGDALNEGLLLLVRHGAASAPAPQHVQPTAAMQTGGSQAFALDPILVRPNSALDAQLFPNVQQTLPGSNQHQYYQRQQLGTTTGSLPAMEPPKAQHVVADELPSSSSNQRQGTAKMAATVELQLVANSPAGQQQQVAPATSATSTQLQPQSIRPSQGRRISRRIKAISLPPHPATSTSNPPSTQQSEQPLKAKSPFNKPTISSN